MYDYMVEELLGNKSQLNNLINKETLNLDNEEEGYLLVSCAGGIRSTATINIEKQDLNNKKLIINTN